jgi:hypothetical protein
MDPGRPLGLATVATVLVRLWRKGRLERRKRAGLAVAALVAYSLGGRLPQVVLCQARAGYAA